MTGLDAQAAALHAEAMGLMAEQHQAVHGRWPEFGWVEVVFDRGRARTIVRVGDACPAYVTKVVRFGELNDNTSSVRHVLEAWAPGELNGPSDG